MPLPEHSTGAVLSHLLSQGHFQNLALDTSGHALMVLEPNPYRLQCSCLSVGDLVGSLPTPRAQENVPVRLSVL